MTLLESFGSVAKSSSKLQDEPATKLGVHVAGSSFRSPKQVGDHFVNLESKTVTERGTAVYATIRSTFW